MFTRAFWRQAIERAVKTAGQTFLAYVGADQIDVLSFEWSLAGGLSGGAALISIVTSLVSEPFGPAETPSVV